MTDRVHVKAELELFVDDADALRKSAFERLRSAWKSDDKFPYDSPGDVPLDEVVASVLADALPIELPGAKRSALSIEAESLESDEDSESDGDQHEGGSDEEQDDEKKDESDDDR